MDDLNARREEFGISFPVSQVPRTLVITFDPPVETAVIIYYRVYLGTEKPSEDIVFNNVVTIYSQTDKASAPQSIRYLSGGEGSGVGNNYSIKITKNAPDDTAVHLPRCEIRAVRLECDRHRARWQPCARYQNHPW